MSRQSTAPAFPPVIPAASAPPPLPPFRVDLWRTGEVVVKHRAHVHDTQFFSLQVPRVHLPTLVRSLRVSDSRGRRPLLHFPAPTSSASSSSTPSPSTDRFRDATHALLARSIGSTISIPHVCTGSLIGVQHLDTRLHAFVATTHDCPTQSTHNSTLHVAALPDHGIVAELATTTSAVALVADSGGRATVSVVVEARGIGPGLLEVEYDTVSMHKPSYELVHSLCASSSILSGTTDITCELHTMAYVPNPLPFDLQQVQLRLRAGHYRHHFQSALRYDADPEHKQEDKPVQDVATRFARGTPTRRAVLGSECSALDVSISSFGTEDDNAWSYHPTLVRDTVQRLSIPAGETVSVPFGTGTVGVSAVHLVDDEELSCRPNVVIKNRTSQPIESGELHVSLYPDDSSLDGTSCMEVESFRTSMDMLNVHDEFYSGLGTAPTMSLSRHVSTRRQRLQIVRAVGYTLMTRTCLRRVIVHKLLNRRDCAQDALVNVASSHSERPSETSAVVRSTGGDEVEIEPTQPINLGFLRYRIRIEGGQRTWLIVTQTLFQDGHVALPDGVNTTLVSAVRRGGEEEIVVNKLQEAAKAKRRRDELRSRRWLHGQKIRVMRMLATRKACEVRSVPEWDGEPAGETGALATELQDVARVEDGVRLLRAEVTRVDNELAAVSRELRTLRDELIALLAAQ